MIEQFLTLVLMHPNLRRPTCRLTPKILFPSVGSCGFPGRSNGAVHARPFSIQREMGHSIHCSHHWTFVSSAGQATEDQNTRVPKQLLRRCMKKSQSRQILMIFASPDRTAVWHNRVSSRARQAFEVRRELEAGTEQATASRNDHQMRQPMANGSNGGEVRKQTAQTGRDMFRAEHW
jgi:hypothetical protein